MSKPSEMGKVINSLKYLNVKIPMYFKAMLYSFHISFYHFTKSTAFGKNTVHWSSAGWKNPTNSQYCDSFRMERPLWPAGKYYFLQKSFRF